MNKKYIFAMSMIGATIVSGMSASENGKLTVVEHVRDLEKTNEHLAKELHLLRDWVRQARNGSSPFQSPLTRKEIRTMLQEQASAFQLPSGPHLPSTRPKIPLDAMELQLRKTYKQRKVAKKMLRNYLIKLTNPSPVIQPEDQWSTVGQSDFGEVIIAKAESPRPNQSFCESPSRTKFSWRTIVSSARKWLFS